MLSDRTRGALIDIRANVEKIGHFMEGLTQEAFVSLELAFYAVTRALEIISEASRRLPDDLRARHPSLPWREIRDAGNVYRHEYGRVLPKRVWQTVQTAIPAILAAVEAELENDASSKPGLG